MKKLIQVVMLLGIALVFGLTAVSSMGAGRERSSQDLKKRAKIYYKKGGSSPEATSTSQDKAFEGRKPSPEVSGSQEPGGISEAPSGGSSAPPPTSTPPTSDH